MAPVKPKIAILMPVYTTVPSICFANNVYFILDQARNFPLNVLIVDSTFITQARNRLIEKFLMTDAEYALFVDSDMMIPKNTIEALLSHEKEVISGLYLRRSPPYETTAMKKNSKNEYQNIKQIPEGEEFEVDSVGFGCFLVKREVIEKTAKQTPIFAIEEKSTSKVKGEDTVFCEKIKKAGYTIWVSKKVVAGHFGGIIAPQNLPER